MASHHLIDAYLAELAARLPGDTIDELADGLIETWQHYRREGMSPHHAAYAAIAEFGTPQQINDAFVTTAPGRRTARMLLATGPLFGICWGASLITAQVWTWPVPRAGTIAFAVMLLAVVATLVCAASSRHSFRRARLGSLGAAGLAILDAAALTAVLMTAPNLVWPMAIAIPASLARIGWTIQALPRPLTS